MTALAVMMDGLPADARRAEDLVAWAIAEEGRGQATVGAVALADWMLASPESAARAFGDPACPVQGENLTRLLAGVLTPGDDIADWIGVTTGGAVLKSQFQQPSAPVDEAAADPTADPPPVGDSSAGFLCEIPGLVGETPGGPLYRAIVDPMNERRFVVAGMGLAVVLDASRGRALLDAVADGLARVPA